MMNTRIYPYVRVGRPPLMRLLVILLGGVMASSMAVAEEAPRSGVQISEAPGNVVTVLPDWQRMSVTQINERLIQAAKAIAARDYALACSELTLVSGDIDSREPQLTYNAWYLLGQCHAGLGMYEEARDDLRKVVEADPAAARPRLDLAMVEQYLGDFAAAGQQFSDLREMDNLDPSVRDKIDDIYGQRPDRLQYGAEGFFGVISDSNINYGPDTDVLHLYNRDLALNRESRPQSSPGRQMGLALTADKLIDRRSRLGGRLSLATTRYSEISDFDSQVLDLQVAWRQKAWGGEYLLQPRYATVTLGGSSLYSITGIEGGYAWLYNDDLRLTAMTGYRQYSYSVASERSTTELKPWLQADYRYSGNLILNARLGYTLARAGESAYSYRDMELALGIDYVIGSSLLLSLNSETSSTDYDGKLEAYDARRSDKHGRFSAELSWNLQQFGDVLKRFSFDLGVRNYTNHSNVDLYQNSRTQSYLTVRAAM